MIVDGKMANLDYQQPTTNLPDRPDCLGGFSYRLADRPRPRDDVPRPVRTTAKV